jgi:hypothetical protein
MVQHCQRRQEDKRAEMEPTLTTDCSNQAEIKEHEAGAQEVIPDQPNVAHIPSHIPWLESVTWAHPDAREAARSSPDVCQGRRNQLP